MRRSISYFRNKENIKKKSDFERFNDFLLGFNKRKFLQQHDENCIILINEENISIFRQSKFWLVDGTFQSCPKEYSQILVVSFLVMGKPFVGAHVLMKNRSFELYISVIENIRILISGCDPAYVVCDFEPAPIKAFRLLFPQIEIGYCLFHFGQIVWRKIQDLGLSKKYKSCSVFKSYIRMFMCVGFLPLYRRYKDLVILCAVFKTAFNEESESYNQIMIFFHRLYFTSEFVVKYELNLVNRLENNVPLTNNYSEAQNHVLNREFNNIKPSTEVLLRKLVQLDYINSISIRDHMRKLVLEQVNSNVIKTNHVEIWLLLRSEEAFDELKLLKQISLFYCFKME